MTESGRPSSHRGARQSPVLQRVVPALAAVAVVVVVILLLIWINGNSPGKGLGAGVITSPTPSATPTPTTSSTPSAVVASTAPVRTPTASAAASPSPSQSPSRRHRAAPLTARAPVVVLNNSTISGLAARVAAQLRSKGWRVTSVGNAQGRFPQTTLYYGTGERGAARHLAHDFPSIQVVHSAAGSGVQIRGHVLTLIVTRYWQ